MNIFNIIIDHLENGKTGVLATIIKKTGPAPQGVGAKIFISQEKNVFGSIGGGCVEAEAIKETGEILTRKNAKIIKYSMNSNDVADEGMVCGGTVDIFLEPVLPEFLNFYIEINKYIQKKVKVIIVTQYGKNILKKSAFINDVFLAGFGMDKKTGKLLAEYTGTKPLVRDNLLIDPIQIKDKLFIYGAGHISQYIAKIAGMIGFDVTVIDDRYSFANKERFPEADHIIAGFFTETIRELDLTENDYHVIVTRGHRNDAEVLHELIKRPSFYIGMIGSKRKIKLVYEYLAENGIDRKELNRVHAPIGMGIDAITPQEIAVSIAAQLVQERAKKK